MNTHIHIFLIHIYIYIYIVQNLMKYTSPSTTLKEESFSLPHGRYMFHRGAHLPRAPQRHFGVCLFRKCGNLGRNGGLRSHVALQCGVFMCLGPCGRRFGVFMIQRSLDATNFVVGFKFWCLNVWSFWGIFPENLVRCLGCCHIMSPVILDRTFKKGDGWKVFNIKVMWEGRIFCALLGGVIPYDDFWWF